MALTEHQRDALARMVVSGLPRATIARALGCSPNTVDRLLKDDEDVKARLGDQQARVLRAIASHQIEMLDMLGDARAAIRDGLHSRDERLRVETARWITEHVVPRTEQSEVNVNIQGQVSHELSGTLQSILGHMVEIRAVAGSSSSYLDRVRSGPTALPGVTVVPPQLTSPTPPDDPDPDPEPEPEPGHKPAPKPALNALRAQENR